MTFEPDLRIVADGTRADSRSSLQVGCKRARVRESARRRCPASITRRRAPARLEVDVGYLGHRPARCERTGSRVYTGEVPRHRMAAWSGNDMTHINWKSAVFVVGLALGSVGCGGQADRVDVTESAVPGPAVTTQEVALAVEGMT